MVKELIKRYPLAAGAVAIFFNLGVAWPFAIFNVWDKFTDTKIPQWLANRGWTMTFAIILWLLGALVSTLVLVAIIQIAVRLSQHTSVAEHQAGQKPTTKEAPQTARFRQRFEDVTFQLGAHGFSFTRPVKGLMETPVS